MDIYYMLRTFFVLAIMQGLTHNFFGRAREVEQTSLDECNGEVGNILHQIRLLMNDTITLKSNSIQAYIVPINDAHQSEYVADKDKRLQYVTKFTGSFGQAIITEKHAVIWTDSRYHLQAEQQLDLNCWTLMKTGLPNVPTLPQWILANIPRNSTIGVDPLLITDKEFKEIKVELNHHFNLLGIKQNLIDLIWKNRPEIKRDQIFPLSIKYSGKEAGLKIADVLNKSNEDDADTVIITALDDIAWLLNLRGSDIDYNPVFFSYIILSTKKSYFFVDNNKITTAITKHLNNEKVDLIFRDYDHILGSLKEMINASNRKIIVSTNVNRAIAELIPDNKRITKNIVAKMKSIKNHIEAENMKKAHIRDGLAVIQYLHWLNNTIDDSYVTEVSGAEKLQHFRSYQDDFLGPSFETISAVGPHSSIVHYTATKETSKRITRNEIYLVDSGGQYRDGTTDVTRTYHFGIPKEEEKISYTRVLKGFISVAMSVFPTTTEVNYLDFIARRFLWQVGLNFGHYTGHGVGMFLLVHEYPPVLRKNLMENMFVTDEPGYYKENEYGIRIEDVLRVVKSDIVNAFNGNGGLTFESITYVPLPLNLIVLSMLTQEEVNYMNTHNKRVMDTIGPILLKHKLLAEYKWLKQETLEIYFKS